MALKIDKKEGSVGSLDEMRIRVVFKNSNGLEIGSDDASENLWVADAIGDLPCVGDYITLSNTNKEPNTVTTQSNYKVSARYIDLNGFIKNGDRIVCTIKLEAGEGL